MIILGLGLFWEGLCSYGMGAEEVVGVLQDDIGSDLQHNLPTSLALPTLYEVRRLNQMQGSSMSAAMVAVSAIKIIALRTLLCMCLMVWVLKRLLACCRTLWMGLVLALVLGGIDGS